MTYWKYTFQKTGLEKNTKDTSQKTEEMQNLNNYWFKNILFTYPVNSNPNEILFIT